MSIADDVKRIASAAPNHFQLIATGEGLEIHMQAGDANRSRATAHAIPLSELETSSQPELLLGRAIARVLQAMAASIPD